MLSKLELENYDIVYNLVVTPPKNNQIWGSDYMLMDSINFMGDSGREKYEAIIEMLDNIWKTREYSLLKNNSIENI